MILRPWKSQKLTKRGHSQSFCVCEQMTPCEVEMSQTKSESAKSSTVYNVHWYNRCMGMRCTDLGTMPSCVMGDWRCSVGFYTLGVYPRKERQGTDHPGVAIRV